MKRFLSIFTGLAIIASAVTSHASVVQFDTGNTGGVYAGTNAPAAVTDATWNGLGANTTNVSGFSFGDGSAATGVTAQLGKSGSGGGAIDWTIGLNDSRNNAAGDTGLYDTLLTSSWFFGRNSEDIGIRISGLAPGVYDVFSINREPNALDRTYDVGIGVGTVAQDFSLVSDLEVTSLTDATGSSTWIDGQNYATERVTVVNTSDWITIIVDPTNGSGEQRFASISGLQIVAVPEPSSAALLGLGLFGLVSRRRRR